MKQLLPERLELVARPYVQLRQQKNLAIVLILAVLAMTLLVPWLAVRTFADREIDWAVAATKLWEKVMAHPWDSGFNLLALLLVGVHVIYLIRVQGRERLVLTRSGVEYCSPLPGWLQLVRKSWSLSWSEVRAIRLRPLLAGGGPQMIALEMEALSKKRQLVPHYWVDGVNNSLKPGWRMTLQELRPSPEALAAQIDDSPLMRYVTAALPQLSVERPVNLLRSGFAIEKNRAALTMTVAFFLLLVYALADGAVLGHETYAGDAPFSLFVMTGAGVLALGAGWMWRNGVPLAESILIALLAGGAAGGATYPATLRLNALTDSQGLVACQYELMPGFVLHPLASGPPELSFPQHHEYWSQFKQGSVHEFELRQGGLGFYQLNLAPYHEKLRSYYEKRKR